jgi:GTPase Era involved in 16S rRNA processing
VQTQRNALDERMMHNVRQARREADAVLALVDAASHPRAALTDLLPPAGRTGPPLAVVLNKVPAPCTLCTVCPHLLVLDRMGSGAL